MTKTPTSKVTKNQKVAPMAKRDKRECRTLAPHELILSPMAQSVVGIAAWGKFAEGLDLAEVMSGLGTQIEQVQGGDMRAVEAMLFGQALTLETMFTNLARRAANQEYLPQFQAHLSLALKAQAQCRATLEALAEIKSPRSVAFVKQANIANQQQVNNGTQPAALPQGGGGIETLPASGLETERCPHVCR